MTVVPLTAEDATLLYAEAPGTQLQIGALCFFEAAPLRDRRGHIRHEDLAAHVAGRLGGLPRFRQRITPVLGDVAAPMWVDDPAFDIERHARHVQLPAPGGMPALRRFMDELLSTPMDPAHPLWDIHTVDGVGELALGDRPPVEVIAVVVRAHHVMADGIALHAAAMLLLDPVPRPPRRQTDHWVPVPAPGTLGLTARAVVERTRRQASLAVGLTKALADPRRFAANARLATQVVASVLHGPPPRAPGLSITGPIGRTRAFAWTSVPMADVVAVKQTCGSTVNDVVLAIATGALRRHLEAAGHVDPTDREPRALIPVGDPGSDASTLSNRFSVTSVTLPLHTTDPLERVRVVHDRMHDRPDSPTRVFAPHVFSVSDIVPPPLLRALVPPVLAHQPLVNLAVSNIPGSRTPLYLWESPMLELYPFIDVVGNVALIIGVLSYGDRLGIGITVDPDVTGDPAELVVHARDAAAELAAAVR